MKDDGRSPPIDVCGKVEAFAAEECEDAAASSQSRMQGTLKGKPMVQTLCFFGLLIERSLGLGNIQGGSHGKDFHSVRRKGNRDRYVRPHTFLLFISGPMLSCVLSLASLLYHQWPCWTGGASEVLLVMSLLNQRNLIFLKLKDVTSQMLYYS